jgi:hypothetical protein
MFRYLRPLHLWEMVGSTECENAETGGRSDGGIGQRCRTGLNGPAVIFREKFGTEIQFNLNSHCGQRAGLGGAFSAWMMEREEIREKREKGRVEALGAQASLRIALVCAFVGRSICGHCLEPKL